MRAESIKKSILFSFLTILFCMNASGIDKDQEGTSIDSYFKKLQESVGVQGILSKIHKLDFLNNKATKSYDPSQLGVNVKRSLSNDVIAYLHLFVFSKNKVPVFDGIIRFERFDAKKEWKMIGLIDVQQHNKGKKKVVHLLCNSFLKRDYTNLAMCFGLSHPVSKQSLTSDLRKSGFGWLAQAIDSEQGQLLIPSTSLDIVSPNIEVRHEMREKHTLYLYDGICPITGKLLWYFTNKVPGERKQAESIFETVGEMNGIWIHGTAQTRGRNNVIMLKNGSEIKPSGNLFLKGLIIGPNKQALIPVSVRGNRVSVIEVINPLIVSSNNGELVVNALFRLSQGTLVEDVKGILKNRRLEDLHAYAVDWLHSRDVFEKNIRFWESLCEDEFVSDSAKGRLFNVGALLSRKLPDLLPTLNRILRKYIKVPSLRDDVLHCVEIYFPNTLRDYVLLCLEENKGVDSAVPYLKKFKNDKQLIDRLAIAYKFDLNSKNSITTLCYISPMLIKSKEGKKNLSSIVVSSAKSASAIVMILTNTRAQNKPSEKDVIEITKNALKLHKDDKTYGFSIMQTALPYLCNIGDQSAIEDALVFVNKVRSSGKDFSIKTTLMSFNLNRNAPFKTLKECETWLKSIKK